MIGVVGGGALGSMVAARLVNGGVDTHLIVRHTDVSSRRIVVNGTATRVPVTSSFNAQSYVICTKAYDAAPVIQKCTGTIVVLSNGLLSIRERAPHVSAATTTHGCYVSETEIVHAGFGSVWLEDAAMAASFERAGLNPVVEPDMEGRLWRKLAANCALNPLTALLQCRNGDVADHPDLAGVCDEIAAICPVTTEELYASVVECAMETAGNFSSMYQDVKHGRRTEIDDLNGYVVRRSHAAGIAAPVNRRLHDSITQLFSEPEEAER